MTRIGLLLAAAMATAGAIPAAQASDPCAGYDVACDSEGCLVCWPDSSGELDLICEEMSLVEVSLTLPGCVGAERPLGLVAPQGPRGPQLIDLGGRIELPQSPAPQRGSSTPSQ